MTPTPTRLSLLPALDVPRLAGAILLVLVCIPLVAAFAPLVSGGFTSTMNRALREPRFLSSFGFGLKQALASTALAVVLGLPGAWFLARRDFPGRRVLSALTSVPFCVPPLIVAIGFVLYFGREGALNRALVALFGLSRPPVDFLFSFAGIVLIHGFYNFPLVMRLVGDAWAASPSDMEDAARLLGAGRVRTLFTVTLPSLAPSIGAAASMVFLLCFFSFVIVMIFGGPGVGTPEVELYRAARFDLDRPLASAFALVETVVAMAALAAYAWFERLSGLSRRIMGPPRQRARVRTPAGSVALAAYVLFVVLFLIGPLASILVESFVVHPRGAAAPVAGLGNYLRLAESAGFLRAFANTIVLGLSSAAIAAVMGFVFAAAAGRSSTGLLASILPLLPLAVSGVVLAYGWTTMAGRGTPLSIAGIQAVSAYPFVMRGIQGAVGHADERYIEAARTLGSGSVAAILRVRLPLAAPALFSGFAFAFAISVGDANALVVAPAAGFETLALLLFRSAGSYRFSDACAAAVILAALSGFVFFLKDAGVSTRAKARDVVA